MDNWQEFENKSPNWKNEGEEPPQVRKTEGYAAGWTVPAGWLNWFWARVSKCLTELQGKVKDLWRGVQALETGETSAGKAKNSEKLGSKAADEYMTLAAYDVNKDGKVDKAAMADKAVNWCGQYINAGTDPKTYFLMTEANGNATYPVTSSYFARKDAETIFTNYVYTDSILYARGSVQLGNRGIFFYTDAKYGIYQAGSTTYIGTAAINCVNTANSAYIPIRASAFAVNSSISSKNVISSDIPNSLLDKMADVSVFQYRYKDEANPCLIPTQERFDTYYSEEVSKHKVAAETFAYQVNDLFSFGYLEEGIEIDNDIPEKPEKQIFEEPKKSEKEIAERKKTIAKAIGVTKNIDAAVDEAENVHTGMSAEEMALVFPDCVDFDEETGAPRGIDYGRLTPVLLVMIQKLIVRVDKMETLMKEKRV